MGTLFTLIAVTLFLGLLASWFLAPAALARLILRSGRQLAGLDSRTIQVGSVRWHYLEGGRGPALLAIHGFGGDADHWLRVAPQLRRHFRIIAPDLVGFGDSAPGNELKFAIDAQVDRVAAFVETLGIDSCVVAGSSMGGWIASRFAERYPEKVRALWLLAPLGVRECETGELLQRINRQQVSPLSITSVEEFDQFVFRPMFAHAPFLPRPLKLHYGRQAVARAADSRRMFSEVIASEPALEEILSQIPVPVLVQWGTEDRAVHISGAERLKAAIETGLVILQPNVGHLPMLEAAELASSQFMKFARDHKLIAAPS
jgi:pimeloyl-ACP methyl ester carboxylesterase